jgi:phosphate uptake regulator
MFFKKLYEYWTGQSLYNEMLKEFLRMLDLCTGMFELMQDFFTGMKKPILCKSKIFQDDKQINRSERKIRKQIMEHLAVNPEEDLPACLILMSVVKDAERIGDFCKNLWEAVHYYGEPIANDLPADYLKFLEVTTDDLQEIFRLTRTAFEKSDSSIADDAVQEALEIAIRCDSMIEELFESNLPARQAVAMTLFMRYMKRIASHLGNISSTVILPLHKIDFPERPRVKGTQLTADELEESSPAACEAPPEKPEK